MLSIIITTFHEPGIRKAIDAVLGQELPEDYELIVAAPDKETEKIVVEYKKSNSKIKYFRDPGRGKSFAMNLLFKEARGDILIFTDGDIYLSQNAINEILNE